MDSLTIAAASGMKSRMESLDLVANNLANAATSGYKMDREFYGIYASLDSDDGITGNPSATLPVVERQWTDFSPGEMQATGNSLDVALASSGFFPVNGPDGPLYTRNGNLKILPSGELATAEGYSLSGSDGKTIHVIPGKPIEISADGAVRQENQPVGTLSVVDFKSTLSLKKVGRMCFENTDAKNAPVAANAVDIQQGKIEGSNVGVAQAAMRLVGVMRQFEMLQKAIGVSNDMDTKSIQEVAKPG
jgi:flagellar basal-body rod protein FlgF